MTSATGSTHGGRGYAGLAGVASFCRLGDLHPQCVSNKVQASWRTHVTPHFLGCFGVGLRARLPEDGGAAAGSAQRELQRQSDGASRSGTADGQTSSNAPGSFLTCFAGVAATCCGSSSSSTRSTTSGCVREGVNQCSQAKLGAHAFCSSTPRLLEAEQPRPWAQLAARRHRGPRRTF